MQDGLEIVRQALALFRRRRGEGGLAVGDAVKLKVFAQLDEAIMRKARHASLPIAS